MGTQRTFGRTLRTSLAIGAVLAAAAFTGVARAGDDLVVDDDGLAPVAADATPAVALGDVCRDSSANRSVVLAALKGTGPSWADGATVSVRATISGTSASGVTAGVGSLLLPLGWNLSLPGTLSLELTSVIAVPTSTLGAFAERVTYIASGPRQGGGSAFAASAPPIALTWTVVDCGPPPDETPPTSWGSATKADATPYTFGDWTNQDVTVTLGGADDATGSGLAAVRYTLDGSTPTASHGTAYSLPFTVSAEGVTTLRWAAVDNVSNVESPVHTGLVKIDKTAPAVLCAADDGAWHAANVALACTATDGPSGLASPADAAFTLSTSVADGTETAAASTDGRVVVDLAGNASPAGPVTGLKVDRKVPSVALTCPAAPLLQWSSATASWTAADGGSGLAGPAGGTLALDTATVGPHTASLPAGWAVDAVGNASAPASCAYGVAYPWSGFRPPLDASGGPNKAKAGSTIPVKFSLGGDRGLDVFWAGDDVTYPASVQVACNGGVLPTPATAESADGRLKYDAAADQYKFSWRTSKAWSGTCRELWLKLADGTLHTAWIDFTK